MSHVFVFVRRIQNSSICPTLAQMTSRNPKWPPWTQWRGQGEHLEFRDVICAKVGTIILKVFHIYMLSVWYRKSPAKIEILHLVETTRLQFPVQLQHYLSRFPAKIPFNTILSMSFHCLVCSKYTTGNSSRWMDLMTSGCMTNKK